MSVSRFVSRHFLSVAVVSWAVATLGAQTTASPPADWIALTRKIAEASDNGNLDDLKAGRAAALRLAVSPTQGVPPSLAAYTVAYADYRLATAQTTPGSAQQDYADEAEQQLRQAITQNDKFADAYGLLSALLALKIGWAASVEAKSSMGPESSQALNRAIGLEPHNPRLMIIKGLGFFRRPAEYGGDPVQAEALFRRAAERLDAASAKDAAWPNWGAFDAHVWLGQALARHGDNAGARAEFAKALAIAPTSSWVKDILLPSVSKGD